MEDRTNYDEMGAAPGDAAGVPPTAAGVPPTWEGATVHASDAADPWGSTGEEEWGTPGITAHGAADRYDHHVATDTQTDPVGGSGFVGLGGPAGTGGWDSWSGPEAGSYTSDAVGGYDHASSADAHVSTGWDAEPYGNAADPYADPYGAASDPYGAADPYGSSWSQDPHGAAAQGGWDAGGWDSLGAQPAPAAPGAPQSPASEPIRVSIAVVDANPQVRDTLLARLGGGATPFGSVEELSSRLTGNAPVVVILGPTCGTPSSLALIDHLTRSHPSLGSILVTDELTTSLLQQALRIGIKDVLQIPGDLDQLPGAIQRVAVGLDAARRSATFDGAQSAQPNPDIPQQRGDVITVFSTKGGAGKSVLATNLAVALAQKGQGTVCLVDADLQFGDVAVMLKLTPHHTIVDAVASLDRMDSALLDSLLVTHEPSGLKVLPAPLEPAFADQVGAAEMVAIVEQLRQFCSYVIVDTPAYFNDVVLGLVEVSDRVVLVAGMDIPNIKNVKIGLQTLRLLNTPMEKLMLVLNRSNSKVKLDIGEVERTLQVKADALIPSDVLIPQSVNKGVPVVLHAPRSPVAKAIQQMAELFLPAHAKRR